MGCCKRITKSKKRIIPDKEETVGYIEGQDGFVEIKYLGDINLRARGCESGHIYLMSPGQFFNMDINDAKCFLESKTDLFEVFAEETKEDVEASSGKEEAKQTEIQEGS